MLESRRLLAAPPTALGDAYTVAEDSVLVVPAPAGPVLRYGFDEAASGTMAALDSGIAPSANATLVSGATRTASTPGGASRGALDLTFADFNSTYATAGDVDKVDGLAALTVTVWVYLQSAARDNDVLLSDIPTNSDPGGTGGWDLTFDTFNGGIFPVVQIHQKSSTSSRSAVGKILTGVDAQAGWTFLAFTYSPSLVLTTYNGSETAPVTQHGGATLVGRPLGGNSAPLSIGRSSSQTSDFDSTPPAWIDDVRIYDRVLSAVELEAVRQEGLTPGGGVLANDTDPDGDPLTATLVSGPANGTLSFFPDGSFHYLPNPNFHGTDSFTYRASDGALQSATATVTITVTPVNDAPVANRDTYDIDEDTPLTIAAPGFLGNDTDVDGDTLTLSQILVPPLLGTLVAHPDGSFTYTPTANFSGTDTIVYKPTDGQVESANFGIITIRINPVNDLPVAADDVAILAEDGGPLAIDVLANDSLQFDNEGDPNEVLAITGVTQPAGGTVTFTPTGLTYTPNPDFFGIDTFTYTVTDSNGGGTDTATVTVTVTPVPDAPLALDDAATTTDAEAVTVAVLANDRDPDGDILSIAAVSPPSHGTATLNPDGTVTYTPAGDFAGTDSFTYTIDDGTGRSDVGTVTVRVLPRIFISDVTVVEGDSGTTFADFTVSLSNASPETITVVGDTSNGTATAGEDYGAVVGSTGIFAPGVTALTFRVLVTGDTAGEPDETFFVDLSTAINAVIADGQGVGTIIDDDNQAPVAVDDAVATDEDTPLVIDVLANDTDADGDPLTASIIDGPSNGTLTVNPDGTFTYTPAANYFGTDSFTYRASDGTADSGIATVTITIRPVNDAPTVAVPSPHSTGEDVPVVIGGISVADVDAAAGTGVVRVTLSVASGTLTVATGVAGGLGAGQVSGNGTGTVVLEGPAAAINATLAAGVTYLGRIDFHGVDALTVTVNDLGNTGAGGPRTAVGTVAIRVLSPSEQIAELIASIESMRAAGILNKGQANSLIVKLENADSKLARGQNNVAENQLGAFLNHLLAFIAEGVLTPEQGRPLRDAAERIATGIRTGR